MSDMDRQKPAEHLKFDHDLKTWSGAFDAVWKGDKRYEFRPCHDRDFKVGNVLLLREWDELNPVGRAPDAVLYTGRWVRASVTYLTKAPDFGIPAGYVVMSIKLINGGCDRKTEWVYSETMFFVKYSGMEVTP